MRPLVFSSCIHTLACFACTSFTMAYYPTSHQCDNNTTPVEMTHTFFVFFPWLHDCLFLFQSEPSPPTSFITPDFGKVTLKYGASNILYDGVEGRELVYSIVRQYTQQGDERTRTKELANFQNAERHLLRMLRGPFDFHRFRGTTLLFALSHQLRFKLFKMLFTLYVPIGFITDI